MRKIATCDDCGEKKPIDGRGLCHSCYERNRYRNTLPATEHHGNWKGGTLIKRGYIRVLCPGHPRANKQGYVMRAILVAEKAIGKYLPLPAIVHHFDGDRSNDSNHNLIVCQDKQYHAYLEARQRAYAATGNPRKRKCKHCKRYDDLFQLKASGTSFYHPECERDYRRGLCANL